jgi:hypothetical protein
MKKEGLNPSQLLQEINPSENGKRLLKRFKEICFAQLEA